MRYRVLVGSPVMLVAGVASVLLFQLVVWPIIQAPVWVAWWMWWV